MKRTLLWLAVLLLLPFSMKVRAAEITRIDVVTVDGDTLSAWVQTVDSIPFDTTMVWTRVAEMYVTADSSDTTGFSLLWNPGDVNRDGSVDISDLWKMIDVMFLGGDW